MIPRARRTAAVGTHDGRIKLQVAAPPVDGKANQVIEKFLAKTLGVRRDAIRWTRGETGRRKTLCIAGIAAPDAAAKLALAG
ncbi:MAG: hypothetical protein ACI9MR_003801 [Myxococcota bacterium]